jgi:hypothetical protein
LTGNPRRPTGEKASRLSGRSGHDVQTGKMLGHIEVTEPRGLHSVEQMPSGEPLTNLQDHVLWMKAN